MAQDNLAIVRRVYDGWAQGDFRVTTEVLDPYAVFVMRPEFPDAGTYLGPEGIAEYTRGFLEPWTKITIQAEAVIPAGDSVVVAVLQRGEGAASGAVTEFRYFQLWTFRGDKVIRIESIRERDDALEEAGLA